MPDWLLLIVIALAVYRLTRLVIKDTFPPVLWLRDHLVGGWRPVTDAERVQLTIENPIQYMSVVREPRVPNPAVEDWHVQDIDGQANRWVERWSWVPYWLADLLSCPWCASGWISLAVVVAVAFTVGVPVPLLVWPAVWAAGSLIAAQKWS